MLLMIGRNRDLARIRDCFCSRPMVFQRGWEKPVNAFSLICSVRGGRMAALILSTVLIGASCSLGVKTREVSELSPLDSASDVAVIHDVAADGPVSRSYSLSQHARVSYIVQNINPFINRYRLSDTTVTYAETAISRFATAGLSIPIPASTTSVRGDELPGAECDKEVGDETLRNAGHAAIALAQDAKQSLVVANLVRGNIKSMSSDLAALDTSLASQRNILSSVRVKESALKQATAEISDAIELHRPNLRFQHRQFQTLLPTYSQLVAALSKRASEMVDKYPACNGFYKYRSVAMALAADTLIATSSGRALGADVAALDSLYANVKYVNQNPQILRIVRAYGDYDDPTIVTVKLQRASLVDTAWATISSDRLVFGQRHRFSLGVGVLGSGLHRKSYTVVERRQNPASDHPADTIIHVISLDEDISARLVPMLSLSAKVFSRGGVSGQLTLGTVPGADDHVFDYFLGAGTGLADDRIILSIGWVSGQTRELENASVGDRVPADQNHPPTTKKPKNAFGASLALRVF